MTALGYWPDGSTRTASDASELGQPAVGAGAPPSSLTLVAHLDILPEEPYRHLECLLEPIAPGWSCCKERSIS